MQFELPKVRVQDIADLLVQVCGFDSTAPAVNFLLHTQGQVEVLMSKDGKNFQRFFPTKEDKDQPILIAACFRSTDLARGVGQLLRTETVECEIALSQDTGDLRFWYMDANGSQRLVRVPPIAGTVHMFLRDAQDVTCHTIA